MGVANSSRAGVQECADLEIGVHWRDSVSCTVDLRFFLPGIDGQVDLTDGRPMQADINPERLDLIDEDDAYGLALGRGLFSDGVGVAYRVAAAIAHSKGIPLRVRLVVDRDAPALHGLRWETLRDPVDGATLLTNENLLFSRYFSSKDLRPVGVRAREELRALAVVAGPTNLDAVVAGRSLAPVRVDEELARAREALGSMMLETLPGAAQPTTANLIDHIRREYDVLYLVCHGYVLNHEPVLLLVDDEGRAAPLLGSELVTQLRELPRLPRLVFLASCQSAGAGAGRSSADAGVLAALGPKLAEAGIPAVVAMQGNISMTTAATFAKRFFSSLDDDGLVDRAMAVARGAVRNRHDWWSPALFMRLQSGRLWWVPGMGPDGEVFDKWPALLAHLRDGELTPIIGPGVSDALLGSRREIARTWADSYRFPMAPYQSDSLPQVAQYLSIHLNQKFPRSELLQHLRTTLVERYRAVLAPELLRADAPLEDLIAAAWEARHLDEQIDPYTVLARLPVPIYITTQPSRLLVRALQQAGKDPVVEVCRWNRRGWSESVFDQDTSYEPTAARPLIFHILGTLDDPRSMVLTEDDYFDFLVGVTSNKNLVPAPVLRRLADSALMFVGFRVDEWDFRVLYRSLMNMEGNARLDDYTNVAVQIDPEESATIDAGGARNYLERYFQQALVSVYWGTAEHFLRNLHERWEASKR